MTLQNRWAQVTACMADREDLNYRAMHMLILASDAIIPEAAFCTALKAQCRSLLPTCTAGGGRAVKPLSLALRSSTSLQAGCPSGPAAMSMM